jgi:hypothetical protein
VADRNTGCATFPRQTDGLAGAGNQFFITQYLAQHLAYPLPGDITIYRVWRVDRNNLQIFTIFVQG